MGKLCDSRIEAVELTQIEFATFFVNFNFFGAFISSFSFSLFSTDLFSHSYFLSYFSQTALSFVFEFRRHLNHRFEAFLLNSAQLKSRYFMKVSIKKKSITLIEFSGFVVFEHFPWQFKIILFFISALLEEVIRSILRFY